MEKEKEVRMTKLKRQVLEALQFPPDTRTRQDNGLPPYSANDVCRILGHSGVSNMARTLKLMEQQGLVVSDYDRRPIACALKRVSDAHRTLRVYWNAETIDQDKAKLQEYHDTRPSAKEAAEAIYNMLNR